jgi:ornithine cyclodeaminase
VTGLDAITLIDGDEVARRAPYLQLVDALAAGHRRPEPHVRRIVYGPPGGDRNFMALPAWEPGEAIGVKLVTIFPDNAARELPTVQAVVLLFDGETGSPLALIDGTELTYRKTAADSALGSRLLSRPDATNLLMVGAGGLAPHLIAAHRAVRPSIERVVVWNRNRDRAERLVELDIADEVAGDLETATGAADIVSTATRTVEPLIRGAWLRPGTHLDCVGAYLPDQREVDDRAVVRSELFVDSRLAAVHEAGDLVIPLAAGIIHESAIRADLWELCRDEHPGRSGPDAITMFENGGGGHLDLMTARFIWGS